MSLSKVAEMVAKPVESGEAEKVVGTTTALIERIVSKDEQLSQGIRLDMSTGKYVSDDPTVSKLCHLINVVDSTPWTNILDIILSMSHPAARETTVLDELWRLFELLIPDTSIIGNINLMADLCPIATRMFADIFQRPQAQAWTSTGEESFLKKYLGVDFEFPDWLCDGISFFLSIIIALFGTTVVYLNDSLTTLIADFGKVSRDFNNIRTLFSSSASKFGDFASKAFGAVIGKTYLTEEDAEYNLQIARLEKLQTDIREQVNALLQDPTSIKEGEQAILAAHQTIKECDEIYVTLSKLKRNTLNARPIIDNVKERMKSLLNIVADVRAVVHAQCRPEPVVTWFTGSPGVGKSHLLLRFRQRLAEVMNEGTPLRNITLNTTEEHQTGLNSQIDIVTFDDFGQSTEDHDHNILFQLVSVEPFRTKQAALEAKGILASPKFIVAASNEAYISQSRTVKQLAALNGRRQKVYAFRNAFVEEYGKKHNGRPTQNLFCDEDGNPTDFAREKMAHDKFFQIATIPNILTTAEGLPDPDEIEVTFEDIVQDAAHRQRIAEKVWKKRALKLVDEVIGANGEKLDAIGRKMSVETVSSTSTTSSTSSTSTETSVEAQVGDAKPTHSPNMRPILLQGSPGTGKTTLANTAFSLHTGKDFSRFSLREYVKLKDDDLKGHVIIDDITIGSTQNFQRVVKLVHRYYDGELPNIDRLLLTSNPALYPEFAKETSPDYIHIFLRRCLIFEFSFKRSRYLGTQYTYDELKKHKVDYDRVVRIECEGKLLTHTQAVNRVLSADTINNTHACLRWISTPVVKIKHADYIVRVRRTFEEAMYSQDTASALFVFLLKEIEVEKGSMIAVMGYLNQVKDALAKCSLPKLQNKSEYDSFVRQFNEQQLKLQTEECCIVHFNDVSLGAMVDTTGSLVFARHVGDINNLDDPTLWDASTTSMYNRLVLRARISKATYEGDTLIDEVKELVNSSTNALKAEVLLPNFYRSCAVLGYKAFSYIGKIVGCFRVMQKHRALVARHMFIQETEDLVADLEDYAWDVDDHPGDYTVEEVNDVLYYGASALADSCNALRNRSQMQKLADRQSSDTGSKVKALERITKRQNAATSSKVKHLEKSTRRQNDDGKQQSADTSSRIKTLNKITSRQSGKAKTQGADTSSRVKALERITRRQIDESEVEQDEESTKASLQYMITDERVRLNAKVRKYHGYEAESESETEKKSNRAAPVDIQSWNAYFKEKNLPCYFVTIEERHLLQYQECVTQLTHHEMQELSGRTSIYFGKENYEYKGVKHEALPIPPWAQDLLDKSNNYGFASNSVLVNVYDGGKRYHGKRSKAFIPRHSDDEPGIDQNEPILTWSVGEQKDLMIIHKKSQKTIKVPMYNNAIFVQEPRMQVEYQHAIEEYSPDRQHPRISYTLRTLRKSAETQLAPIPSLYRCGSANDQILKNQAYVVHQRTPDEKESCLAHALFLTDTWGISNRHVFEFGKTGRTYVQHEDKEYDVEWAPVYDDASKDLAVFKVTSKQRPPCRDIRSYIGSLTDRQCLQGLNATIQIGTKSQSVARNVVLQEHKVFSISRSDGTGDDRWKLVQGTGVLQDVSTICRVTKKGDCGSPWVLDHKFHPRPMIAIHSAGNNASHVYGTLVYIEDVENALHKLNKIEPQVKHVSDVVLNDKDCIIDIDEQHAPFAECLSRVCEVIGQTSKPLPTPRKTKYTRSPLNVADSTISDLITDDFSPAAFSMDDPRIHHDYDGHLQYDAQLKWVFGQPKHNVTRAEIIECIDELSEYAISCMRKATCTTGIRTLTTTQAINGLDKERFPHSNPINRKSSPGFPFVVNGHTSKMKFLDFDETHQIWKLNKNDGQHITDMISQLTNSCRQNVKAGVVFMSCQKDEVLKSAKVWGNPPKTRSFAAGPLHMSLLWRKYFLAAEQNCHNIAGDSFFTGGIDPAGVGWHTMISSLLEVGNAGFDEDTPSYDAHMCNEFLEEQWRFYDAIYKRFDPAYKEEDMNIRRGIYMQLANPLITMEGLVLKMGGHVSGKPATRTDNDVYNAVLKLMCWKAFCRKVHSGEIPLTKQQKNRIQPNWSSYNSLVRSKFGGDDHICTVTDWLAPYWNFKSFKALMQEVWGVEITDAQKSKEDYTVRPLTELEFLKRYSYCNNGVWRGKLLLSSFDKLMNWTRCSTQRYPYIAEFGPIIVPEDMESEVDAVLRESVLHGPEFFQRIHGHVSERLLAYGINITLKTWNDYNVELFTPLSRDGFRIEE
jgi:hypothetical protein